jgi:hypothetical protein
MPIFVDLKSLIVTPDREVYVARPGKAYKLYRSFVDNEIVGPDWSWSRASRSTSTRTLSGGSVVHVPSGRGTGEHDKTKNLPVTR